MLNHEEKASYKIVKKFQQDFKELLQAATMHPEFVTGSLDIDKLTGIALMGMYVIEIGVGLLLSTLPNEASEEMVKKAIQDGRNLAGTVNATKEFISTIIKDKAQ